MIRLTELLNEVCKQVEQTEAEQTQTEDSKPAKGKKWKTNGVSHGQKGVKTSPGSSRGDAYCARSAGIKGDWKSDPKSPNNLSRKKWKCRGKKSMK